MLEYLYLANWDHSLAFLASGSPPMYVRLLALNAFFLALYAIRRTAGAQPMGPGMTLFVQGALLCANLLVLFQSQVEAYLKTVIQGL